MDSDSSKPLSRPSLGTRGCYHKAANWDTKGGETIVKNFKVGHIQLHIGCFSTVPSNFQCENEKKKVYKKEILMFWCQIQWELKRAGQTQRQIFIGSIRQVTLDHLWLLSKVSTPLLFLFYVCPCVCHWCWDLSLFLSFALGSYLIFVLLFVIGVGIAVVAVYCCCCWWHQWQAQDMTMTRPRMIMFWFDKGCCTKDQEDNIQMTDWN